jgi:hypothetical protein
VIIYDAFSSDIVDDVDLHSRQKSETGPVLSGAKGPTEQPGAEAKPKSVAGAVGENKDKVCQTYDRKMCNWIFRPRNQGRHPRVRKQNLKPERAYGALCCFMV